MVVVVGAGGRVDVVVGADEVDVVDGDVGVTGMVVVSAAPVQAAKAMMRNTRNLFTLVECMTQPGPTLVFVEGFLPSPVAVRDAQACGTLPLRSG